MSMGHVGVFTVSAILDMAEEVKFNEDSRQRIERTLVYHVYSF